MIIRDSHFLPDPWGHGGCKRTAQISEILRDAQIDSVFLDDIITLKDPGKIRKILNGIDFLHRFPLHVKSSFPLLYKYGHEYAYCRFFESINKPSVILWENNHSSRSNIPFLAKQAGVPVIALPHNLESLVPTQKSFLSNRNSPEWFEEELACLSWCARVFVISREEQWLLRLHGIKADFLPYYPPFELAKFFSSIRSLREKLPEKKDILMLGTATNPPTLQGMLDRIHFYKKERSQKDILHIVGSNTEQLKNEVGCSSNIVIHGRIDQKKLEQLLVQVKAAIVHQPPTSGALTRIIELISAGVPVIADINSSRTWGGMDGLYSYEDDDELLQILKREFSVPSTPQKGCGYNNRFIATIHNYIDD